MAIESSETVSAIIKQAKCSGDVCTASDQRQKSMYGRYDKPSEMAFLQSYRRWILLHRGRSTPIHCIPIGLSVVRFHVHIHVGHQQNAGMQCGESFGPRRPCKSYRNQNTRLEQGSGVDIFPHVVAAVFGYDNHNCDF